MTRRFSRCWAIGLSVAFLLAAGAVSLRAQPPNYAAEAAAIMRADADFAKSVADRDKTRFLTFIADVTTFNGGTAGEIHGRDAVMKEWNDFFDPAGPALSWAPTKAEVLGGGDLGYSTGSSLVKGKNASGVAVERRGQYLTVWRKQPDGAWRVVFDTGSNLVPSRER